MASPSSPKVPIPRRGVDYRNKVVLAPMVRSGELPTRLLALKYGADLVWGPETIDRALIGTTRRINPHTSTVDYTRLPSHGSKTPSIDQKESLIYRLHPSREHRRLIFQLGTSSPERAVEAAKLVAGDVAGIDVNAGCPKPFSTLGGMGAALLQTPDTLCRILEALVKEVGTHFEIGISVKIRLLDTPELTENLVRRLCRTGITGLTVHCRTTPMRPRERAIREQLHMIAKVCQESGVACVMNGDVQDRDTAIKLAQEFGVDGSMIATYAEANPSCFRTAEQGGLAPWREIVREYMQAALDVDNKWGNTKFMLVHFIPGKEAGHRDVIASKNYAEVCEALGMDDMMDRARDVDQRIGLGQQSPATVGMAKATNQTSNAAGREHSRSEATSKEPISFEMGGGVGGVSSGIALGV
ncbi:MAG: hypothetical protein M1833_002489 [Piccolia ochrophora]|nr:MAG: hypothetical protein M1833_002489 [Piccolia ochrophora]